MFRQRSLTIAAACLLSLTAALAQSTISPPASPPPQLPAATSAAPAAATVSPGAFWFTEAGATSGNGLLGGLGVAIPVAGGQQIFGELALQTGSGVGQSSTLLIGVKSNYPAITVQSHKLTPFTIVAYGASIQNLVKSQIVPPAAIGLDAAAVTSIGTSAGFAQQYAAGFETKLGSWNLGVGVSGDKVVSGWKGYPFVFLSHSFGSAK
jgi:hypothetical protein